MELSISLKIMTMVGTLMTPALLDSDAQDCFINEGFARYHWLLIIELPKYLQQYMQNADNSLSE